MEPLRSEQFEPAVDTLMKNAAWIVVIDTFRFRFMEMQALLRKCKPDELGYNQGQINEIEYVLKLNDKSVLLTLAEDFLQRTNGENDAKRIDGLPVRG